MTAEVYAEDGYYAVIPEWVLDSDVSAQAIRLYAVLRRYADQRTMHAHPSRRTLADRMRVASTRTVDSALAELVDLGAVDIIERYREDGSRTSSGYYVRGRAKYAPQNMHPPVQQTAQGYAADCAPPVQQTAQQEPQPENHSQEPQELTLVEPVDEEPSGDPFDEFWTAYPRKVGKRTARQAWARAIRRVNPDKIIAAVREYPFSTDLQYVKHPTSWLNAESWNDDRAAVRPRTVTSGAYGPRQHIPTDPDAHRGAF